MTSPAHLARPADANADALLATLRAAAESTRLRILAVLDGADLTVTELTQVLAQSQPRISRHLKSLCDAGLLQRFQEGSWAFYRLADGGAGAEIARTILGWLPSNDPVFSRDRERLGGVRRARAASAARYFAENAPQWDRIRSLHVPDSRVETAMLAAVDGFPADDLLDIGTGTGRVLQVFAGRIRRGIGVDTSREMLTIARARLEELGLRHCQVRHADIFSLDIEPGSMDVVTVHHVLHFLDDPASAIREACRVLRPGGRLLIVDFAPHGIEYLRRECAHRRLGFEDDEVGDWCSAAGLEDVQVEHLRENDADRDKLVVSLWSGTRARRVSTLPQRAVP